MLIDKDSEFTKNVMNIKNLININKLSNLLLRIYSHKIAREEAERTTLNNELNYIYNEYKNISGENELKDKDEFFEEYIDNFFKSLDFIKTKLIKYKSKILYDLEIMTGGKFLPLSYFLIDDKGIKGMYLASAYENMIEWQNDLIHLITENNKNDGILSKYFSLLGQEINIQDAKSNQIINIDENVFNKFNELLFANLMRNINTSNMNNF